jgi:hypothetical protein
MYVSALLIAVALAFVRCDGSKTESLIHFSPDVIPLVNEPLPAFELGKAVNISADFISSILENVVPKLQLQNRDDCDIPAAYYNDTLIAFLDPTTGESGVFPLLERIDDTSHAGAKINADQIAANRTLFPLAGFEELVSLPPIKLSRSNSSCKGNATVPEKVLSYIRLQRKVNGYPVIGPGTKAMVAIAQDGSIHGFSHLWRPASSSGKTVTPSPREEIANAILEQISTTAKLGESITVDNVTVAYYDGGNFLEPVYLFETTIRSRIPAPNPTIRRLGFVSIGSSVGPIQPVCPTVPDGPLPVNPPTMRKRNYGGDHHGHGEHRKGVRVGRYVDRNDNIGWINSAIDFWNNLLLGAASSPNPIDFLDSQYFWAFPNEFLSEKDSYVNAVHIALTEVHGNWNEFWTLSNYGDSVSLADIEPLGGYGSNACGSLAYWIIHSCEVIPTQTDEPTSFDVWLGIFKGMHSAMGYRTEMWICDGVTADFGRHVGRKAPVVASWFHSVAISPYYGTGDSTYFDGNRGMIEPMGRPASVSVCGHVDDTAEHIEGLPNPACLIEYWFEN